MARDKVRIRFRKTGDLRLVSHHDLMRSFERMLRRAELPFRSTEGFHPTPRLVFALALPLGVAAQNEVVELELTEEVPADEVLDRLRRQAPPGIEFLTAKRIAANVTARPRKALYRLPVSPETMEGLGARRAAFLQSAECWVERLRPTPRRINIRPFVDTLELRDHDLVLTLWVGPDGSARADEVLRALGLGACLDDGAVLERMDLWLWDELDPLEAARAPELSLKDARPLPVTDQAAREPANEPAPARWGAAPNGPLVE